MADFDRSAVAKRQHHDEDGRFARRSPSPESLEDASNVSSDEEGSDVTLSSGSSDERHKGNRREYKRRVGTAPTKGGKEICGGGRSSHRKHRWCPSFDSNDNEQRWVLPATKMGGKALGQEGTSSVLPATKKGGKALGQEGTSSHAKQMKEVTLGNHRQEAKKLWDETLTASRSLLSVGQRVHLAKLEASPKVTCLLKMKKVEYVELSSDEEENEVKLASEDKTKGKGKEKLSTPNPTMKGTRAVPRSGKKLHMGSCSQAGASSSQQKKKRVMLLVDTSSDEDANKDQMSNVRPKRELVPPPRASNQKKTSNPKGRKLAEKVDDLKWRVDALREEIEELQLSMDGLAERIGDYCEEVYTALELQINELRHQLETALKKLGLVNKPVKKAKK